VTQRLAPRLAQLPVCFVHDVLPSKVSVQLARYLDEGGRVRQPQVCGALSQLCV
jgi:hypothetical protein